MSSIHVKQGSAKKEAGVFSSVTSHPAFSVLFNVGLFVTGIAFIQSPLMDALAPQL